MNATTAAPAPQTTQDTDSRRRSVHRRLTLAREAIYSKKLVKSGSGSRFSYFERSDFMPQIMHLCAEFGLCPVLDLSDVTDFRGTARLVIHADDNPEDSLAFSMPVAGCSMKGAPMQDVGAMVTYASRYLYTMAFEIAESDPTEWSYSNNVTREAIYADLRSLGTDFGALARAYGARDVDAIPDAQLIHALSIKREAVARARSEAQAEAPAEQTPKQ